MYSGYIKNVWEFFKDLIAIFQGYYKIENSKVSRTMTRSNIVK